MARRVAFATIAVASLVASPAFAASLFAPFTFVAANTNAYCIITNVGPKPIEVTASAKSFFGNDLTPEFNNCPAPPGTLDAGDTCYASFVEGQDATCGFTAKGKVRASTHVLGAGNEVLIVIPATAK